MLLNIVQIVKFIIINCVFFSCSLLGGLFFSYSPYLLYMPLGPFLVLLLGLFSSFFYALFYQRGMLWYWKWTGRLFSFVGVQQLLSVLWNNWIGWGGGFSGMFTYTFLYDASLTFWVLLVIVFYFIIWGLFFIDSTHSNYNSLELWFFINLLFGFFLCSLFCFNFLLVFFLMEGITLLVVISCVTYLIFFNPQLVRVILQFFVLNVFISIFFLIGTSLFLFLVQPSCGEFSLFYGNVYNTIDGLVSGGADVRAILGYYKVILIFFLMTFLFKLTLAPFSIWVVRIYSALPYLFLLVVMTIYKIIYLYLFLRIFFVAFNYVPEVQAYWTQVTLLCSIISMFIGCLAFKEQDIKTFLAYTTVSQMGVVMLGCSALSVQALQSAILYLIMYCLQITCFVGVLILAQKWYHFTNFQQLFLLKFYKPLYFYVIILIFLSFLGVPPLSGFFTKFFLLYAVYQTGWFVPAVLGFISSFFLAVVYLQVVLQLLWDKPAHTQMLKFESTKFFMSGRTRGSLYQLLLKISHLFILVVGSLTVGFVGFLPLLWCWVRVLGQAVLLGLG